MSQKQDRLAAEQWAQGLLQRDDWCILDTETTGLKAAEICQIAIIDGQGKTLLDSLVKPTKRIGRGATQIHEITNAMVADAPTFPEVYPGIRAAIEDKTVVIYNARFDRGVISHCCKIHKLPLILTNTTCAMLFYSAWVGSRRSSGDYRWQKLPGGDHTALGDCRATLNVIKKMAG